MRRAGRREKARVYSDPVVGGIVNSSTMLFAALNICTTVVLFGCRLF